MAELTVVDASPLIVLTRAGLLGLLQLASDQVFVPDAVAREVGQRGSDDPAARALHTTEWLRVVTTSAPSAVIQAHGLGAGESAVLAWAEAHSGTEAIIDDAAGGRLAATLRISTRGTLGLVLLAKQFGRIPAARPVLEGLRDSGLFLSRAVLDEALRRVGE